MSGFVDRENQIFNVIQGFNDRDLQFVVVGGYAVSAFQHRFSVDADLVLRDPDLHEFIEVLEDNGFEEAVERELVYGGRYLAYEKDRELPVTIDLLVNSLQCRQTDASWSYRYFEEHSITELIEGSERSVEVQIPEKELLVAVKLHSGRLTDARDVVALADDLEFEQLERHIDRGVQESLRRVLDEVDEAITRDNFEDSFKGVFQQGKLPEDNIQKIHRFIQQYR